MNCLGSTWTSPGSWRQRILAGYISDDGDDGDCYEDNDDIHDEVMFEVWGARLMVKQMVLNEYLWANATIFTKV